MFSTDFIFRQQENLVDKILLTTKNVRLDSGHYATKYYFCCLNQYKLYLLKSFIYADREIQAKRNDTPSSPVVALII